ncbi:three-prime repair exonuclease 1-like [Pecten maximus]|uniref:three-prime repair exonuclease 1-like n=1 Tax=Pecten maximus TaxID=6579 RepID=UPI001458AAF3|nr:three-prime repair exonuclease 1-like [Pecten maximus]
MMAHLRSKATETSDQRDISEEISTFVFLGLTGSAVLPLNPSILEISLLPIERSDILLLAGQGLPRSLNRLTMTFKPHRSPIPIRVMQNTELLDSSVEHSQVICAEDVTIIEKFIERLPGPVCLISYSANIYDYRVIKNELNKLNRNISRHGLFCTSLRKAVCELRPELISHELNDVYRELCNGEEPDSTESAEGTVRMLTEIVSHLPGVIGWMDLHNELF